MNGDLETRRAFDNFLIYHTSHAHDFLHLSKGDSALWFFTSLLLMDSPANRSRVGVTADEGWCCTSFSWTKLCYCWFWLRYCELPLSRVRTVRLHWVLSVTLSSVRLMNMSHVVKRRVSVFLAWNVPIWIKHCSVWPPVFSQLLSLWQICDHKAW